MDKVAIVILNWNGEKFLEKYLPVVIEHSEAPGVTVYVADNGSTDCSLALLEKSFPAVRVIDLGHNWGFAEGYNRALERIDAEYFVLLNSDVEVTQGWLSPIVSFMDGNKDVAACQPKLLALKNRNAFEYAGACGGYIDRFGYPFCRGRIFDTVEYDHGQYDDAVPIMWATGACLVVRSVDYRAVGGLDGRFFAHNEEIDLCWRLLLMGRRIYCMPSSVVYHLGGGTLPMGNPRKTFLNFRNNLTMLYKNLTGADLFCVMLVRFFLDYVAAFRTLICNGNYGDFCAIIRARIAFWRWRGWFKVDRSKIRPVYGRKPYSILWQYYVHGHRKYSDLG